MATTGKTRLNDKHADKRKKAAKVADKMLARIDGNLAQASAPAGPMVISNAQALNADELIFYMEISEQLEATFPETCGNYRLAAINLAKMCALGKRLEKEIENTGGLTIETDTGLRANPLLRVLQTTQGQIASGLKALGLTHNGNSKRMQAREAEIVSEFSQFN